MSWVWADPGHTDVPEVRLLGVELRRCLGGRSIVAPAGDVRELLARLVERGGAQLAEQLYEDPRSDTPAPHRDLRVLVNGRNSLFLEGLDTPLSEEDTVTIHFAGSRSFPGG